MKQAKTAIGLAALAAVVWGAGTASLRVKLEEVLRIGGPDEDVLFLWCDIAVDREDNVYVVDALDCSIKKFDAGGRLLKKVGRKGQGPGEFEDPRTVAVSPGRVYATDQNAPSIRIFDGDLVYQKSLPVPGFVSRLTVLSDGTLAAGIRFGVEPERICLLGPEGDLRKEIIYGPSGRRMSFDDAATFEMGPGGEVFLGFLFRDRIERREADGSLTWERAPLGIKGVATAAYRGYAIPTETCVLDIAMDSRGRIFTLGGKKAGHPGRDIRVFDSAGRPLAAFVLPERSHTIHFDHKDFLYVSADAGVTLKKYRVTWE